MINPIYRWIAFFYTWHMKHRVNIDITLWGKPYIEFRKRNLKRVKKFFKICLPLFIVASLYQHYYRRYFLQEVNIYLCN